MMADERDDSPPPQPARTGRRPVDANDTSVQVCVTLPSKKHAHYCRIARRQDLSVPEVIRRLLSDKKI